MEDKFNNHTERRALLNYVQSSAQRVKEGKPGTEHQEHVEAFRAVSEIKKRTTGVRSETSTLRLRKGNGGAVTACKDTCDLPEHLSARKREIRERREVAEDESERGAR